VERTGSPWREFRAIPFVGEGPPGQGSDSRAGEERGVSDHRDRGEEVRASGATTVREAVERYGSDAKLVVPIEPEGFFAAEEPRRSVAGLESARSGERVAA